MGFLERAIRKGVSDAVSKAVGNAVQKAVEPTATELANKAANAIDNAVGATEQTARQRSGLEGAMANLQRSVEGYATEAAKNIKVCPACGEGATADKKFCPRCGAKLPEKTVAEGAVCPSCGRQNTVGTKFCCDCGSKLPAAIQEEQIQADRNASVMARWEAKLPQYPKWNQGGTDYSIEEYDPGVFSFSACFNGDSNAASRAVAEYLQYARGYGFHPAGQYPDNKTLYNKIDGVCYCIDTTDCLAGDSDRPSITLFVHEPHGGYDYVKPEPKKKTSFFDLFK